MSLDLNRSFSHANRLAVLSRMLLSPSDACNSKEEFGQTPCCVGVSGDNSVTLVECRLHGFGAAVLTTGSAKVILKSCRLPKPPDAQTACRFCAIVCLHTSEVFVENCEFRYVRAPLVACLHRARVTIR